MKISSVEFLPASIAYTRREVSSQVHRDGVTNVVVKVTTDEGLVGWGESCTVGNVEAVLETLKAMTPFVCGRSPWETEIIRAELWHRAAWMFLKPIASFAYAGIDMALWDLCGKQAGLPLYKLFGGKVRNKVNYFYYLARGSANDVTRQCEDGLARGFHVFYIKVGLAIEEELEMVRALRAAIGPKAKIRIDANGAWNVNQALRNLAALDQYGIDFVEQPVREEPPENLLEVRSRCPVAICQNEGLWTTEDAYRSIKARTADVYCFSPYWVGSLGAFQRLAYCAHFEGLRVCRHTHGEFGIAAAACHHLLLTLPNVVDGNQTTAQIMTDDLLTEPLPIATRPDWGVPDAPGLGVTVNEDKLEHYHEAYRCGGSFPSYDPCMIRKDMFSRREE